MVGVWVKSEFCRDGGWNRRGSYGLSCGVPVEACLFFRSDDTDIGDRIDRSGGL